jgi:hypothetical protein
MNYHNLGNLKDKELWNAAQEEVFAYIRQNSSGHVIGCRVELILREEFIKKLENISRSRDGSKISINDSNR